jgi:plastocyanin
MSTQKTIAILGIVAAIALALGSLPYASVSAQASYVPQTRQMFISTVPLVTHEQQQYLPGLKGVFGSTGVLNKTEVYGFNPDTIVVYQGDRIRLTVINAQPDDSHTFTIDAPYSINIGLKANSTGTATFVATHVGVYNFYCAIPGHVPWMHGTLLVLPDSVAAA